MTMTAEAREIMTEKGRRNTVGKQKAAAFSESSASSVVDAPSALK